MTKTTDGLEAGNVVKGKVVRIRPFGAIISLAEGMQGLVHISHISDEYVQNITDYLNKGDIVDVKVLSADVPSGKISLSLKDAKIAAETREDADERRETPEERTEDFEDKFKKWLKISNEKQAGLNKRNKRK
ncbi:MAG: S1 RNA-binding domain-containing protein [Clostridiales bacterium]|nr:S1 RNA-binding domain-containing protein [Clostridiales bacterium]